MRSELLSPAVAWTASRDSSFPHCFLCIFQVAPEKVQRQCDRWAGGRAWNCRDSPTPLSDPACLLRIGL